MGRALHRLADELTAFLGGLLGYIGVLAALGVLVISILEMDVVGAGMMSTPRADSAAVERPYVLDADPIEAPSRPELRRSMAAR